MPAKPQPVLRTLTRHRTTQIAERQRGVNRLHTALEHTGSKLDCLATDILDRSRRAMLDALVAGTTTTSAGAEGVRGAPLDGEDAVERARVDAAQRP